MKAKVRKSLNYLLQFAIILSTYWFIYRELFQKRDIGQVTTILQQRFSDHDFIFYILITLALMLLNWGTEAQKWKFLIGKFEHISFLQSFKAVFSGVTVSVFMPNRIGEYFGRVFILKQLHPLKGIFITVIGSMGQLMATIIAGLLCGLFFLPRLLNIHVFPNHLLFWGIVIAALLVVSLLILLYFNFSLVSVILKKLIPNRFKKFENYTDVFESYKTNELAYVLSLSVIRYLVFTIQFILLLLAFGVNLPLKHFLTVIPVIFLALTIIPTITLSEPGIRGSLSLYLLGFYLSAEATLSSETTIGIVAASTLLWLINLAIPAIAGTFFVFNLRFIRSNKKKSES